MSQQPPPTGEELWQLQQQVAALTRRVGELERQAGMLDAPVRCPECQGRGEFPPGPGNPGAQPLTCAVCQGSGNCPGDYWDD